MWLEAAVLGRHSVGVEVVSDWWGCGAARRGRGPLLGLRRGCRCYLKERKKASEEESMCCLPQDGEFIQVELVPWGSLMQHLLVSTPACPPACTNACMVARPPA